MSKMYRTHSSKLAHMVQTTTRQQAVPSSDYTPALRPRIAVQVAPTNQYGRKKQYCPITSDVYLSEGCCTLVMVAA